MTKKVFNLNIYPFVRVSGWNIVFNAKNIFMAYEHTILTQKPHGQVAVEMWPERWFMHKAHIVVADNGSTSLLRKPHSITEFNDELMLC